MPVRWAWASSCRPAISITRWTATAMAAVTCSTAMTTCSRRRAGHAGAGARGVQPDRVDAHLVAGRPGAAWLPAERAGAARCHRYPDHA
ncbi:hypothetical protein G6F40_017776 [Rhizopus arrhizus]|nr:hypothetical protein G6F40_017776 [Rhizopus arrhizus]